MDRLLGWLWLMITASVAGLGGGSYTPPNPTVYYIDGVLGSDSNTGLSAATPWKTSAPITAFWTANPGPQCVTFALKSGQRWFDTFTVKTLTNVTASTTLTTNPPNGGSASCPVTLTSYSYTGGVATLNSGTAYISGAPDLTGTWTATAGYTGVWQMPCPSGGCPGKLYEDSAMKESVALIPVPNYTGSGFDPSVNYKYLDQTSNGYVYVTTARYGAGTTTQGQTQNWYPTYYGANKTGVQNVAAGIPTIGSTVYTAAPNVPTYKGVWYTDGVNIYVNLADGSNPNSHVFQGATRPNGVYLESANYVTISANITVQQTIETGILSFQSADSTQAGHYYTGEYINIFASVYNTARQGGQLISTQTNYSGGPEQFISTGEIVVASGGANAGGNSAQHLIRGIFIGSPVCDSPDVYYDGAEKHYCVDLSGIDGGGAANNLVVSGLSCHADMAMGCLAYSHYANPTLINSGGHVTGVNFTGSSTNFEFTATCGGLVDYGTVSESYGPGIQIGGGSNPTTSCPTQKISHMLLMDLGKSPNGINYNGIDCNTVTNFYNLEESYNTIVNTNSASITLEASGGQGCVQAHIFGNVFAQNYLEYPSNYLPPHTIGGPNNSNILFYVQAVGSYNPSFTFDHNLYILGTGQPYVSHTDQNSLTTCGSFVTTFPDSTSTCLSAAVGANAAGFVNYPHDMRLAFSSQGFGAGVGGAALGAMGTLPISSLGSSQASGAFSVGVHP